MDIIKNEKNKILKRTLIILIMFAIMIILSTVISSLTPKVNAATYTFDVRSGSTTYYEFKTITGNTWSTNERVARLYDYLYDIDPESDSLPTVSDLRSNELFIGADLGQGYGYTDKISFHRYGTLIDYGNINTAVNVICFEPETWTFESGDYSNHVIRQILYITPTKITFYKQNTNSVTGYTVYEIATTEISGYNFQKFLSQAYKSQYIKSQNTEYYTTAYKAAQNLAYHFTGDKTWINALNDKDVFGSGVVESGFKSYQNVSTSLNYTGDTSNYEYSGIFIWYAGNKDMSQGRVAYRVVREKKVPTVTLTLNKEDFSGNSVDGAIIQITPVKNVASINNATNSVKLSLTNGTGTIKIVPEDGNKSVQIKITETTTPSGYATLPSEGITLTISYDSDRRS